MDCVLAGLERDPHLQAVEQRPDLWLEQLLPQEFPRSDSQPKEQSTMTLFSARSRRASS